MARGICYGVSVGPGARELITLEAISTIEASDIVFLPSFPKEECKAYQIIKEIMPQIDDKDIRCETFTMSRDAQVANIRHDEIYENVVNLLEKGKNIAFLTLGEVSLYSTYLYIHSRLLEGGYESVLVNGISSIQAISSRLNIPLALGKEQVHIFPDASDLDAYLNQAGTRIFMKPKGSLADMVESITKYVSCHEGMSAMGISNCGMQNEIVARNVNELPMLNGYFTVIFVVGEDKAAKASYKYFENHSCKYYPCHKGIEHVNCLFCYCPMYRFENCLGNPSYIEKNGKKIKNCTNCAYPHDKNHYDSIMDFLKNQ